MVNSCKHVEFERSVVHTSFRFNYEALPSSAVVHVKLVCIHSTFAFQGHYNWKTMENNEKTNAIHMLHSPNFTLVMTTLFDRNCTDFTFTF